MALVAASVIAEALKEANDAGQRLAIAAGMPKPVSFAIGMLLRQRFSVEPTDLANVDFIIHGSPPRSYGFFAPLDSFGGATPPNGLVNLTAHAVRIVDERDRVVFEMPAPSVPARLSENYQSFEDPLLNDSGLKIDSVSYGRAQGLPEPSSDNRFIVSRVFAAAHPERTDLVFPLDEVRNKDNQIVGCRRLGTFAKE